MGRADRPRERHSRPSTGSAHALTPGLRRPAGPASLSRFGLSRLPRLGAAAAACLLALAFALLLGAGAAEAQTSVKLVGNTGESDSGTVALNRDHVLTFRTGGHTAGYKLDSVKLKLRLASGNAPTFTVSIQNQAGTTTHGTLTQQGNLPATADLVEFTASGDGIQLAASTTYRVELDVTAAPNSNATLGITNSNAEDADSLAGWLIGKDRGRRDWNTTNWIYEFNSVPKIEIYGHETDATPPAFQSAAVNGTALTVTFDENLAAAANLANGAFTVKKTPSGGTQQTVPLSGSPSISGATVTLALASAVLHTDTGVKVSYTTPTTGSNNKLRDPSGNEVASFTDKAVTNNTPGPARAQVRKASVSGSTLTLTFWGPLDEDSITQGSAFKVWTTHRPPRRFRGTGTARISGNTVKVMLNGAIPGGPGVHMAYSMPSKNPLRYASGHPIESFTDSDRYVAFLLHNRGDRTPPTLLDVTVWSGGHPVSGSHLRLDFDELLNAGSVPEGKDFDVTVNGERRPLFPGAPAHIQGATLRLWLNAVVRAGDRVEVSYTRHPYHLWNIHYGPLMDLTRNFVEDFSARAASNAEGPPVFSSAEVNGTTLTLAFNEPLDEGSVSAPGDFHVTVGGARRFVAAGGVAIDGATVALTLESAVADRETGVRVRYTRGATPLRDRGGNAAASFADRTVTNVTPPGLRSAQVTGNTLTLLFDEVLDRGSVPAPGDFQVTVGDARRDVAAGGVAIDGAKVTLTLLSPVAETDTVTVSYGKRENPLRDRAGNEIADFSKRPVTWVAGPPVVESAEVNGATLTLTFDQDLDEGSVPAPGRFHVTVGGARRGVASGGVAIDGATVTLTLSTAVAHGETGVKVRYTRGANPLRNAAGFAVASFGDQAVDNVTLPPDEILYGGLVSNLDVGAPTAAWHDVGDGRGQPFTTGTNAAGYKLTRVVLAVRRASTGPEPSYSVTIRSDSSGNPGSTIATLENPASLPTSYEALEFEATGGIDLDSSETYFVVLEPKAGSAAIELVLVNTNSEDPASLTGWSLGSSRQLDSGSWSVSLFPVLTAIQGYAKSGTSANSGPSFHSASVKGNQLTVSFDEALDEDSAPPGDAFRVRTLPDGGGTGKRSAQGQGGTSSGTGATTVEGRTVTVTLDRPVAPGDRVVVSYDRPDENPVRDESGDEAEGFSARPAANVPPVTAVAVVSDAGSDDTYAFGDTIRVRVTFAEKVNVDTAGGTPRLTIKMDPTWGEFRAAYAGGSGRRNLIFTHKVVEPNTSPRGIAVLANTLELNGGTIRSKATGADADLAHSGLGHDASHKVNWRIQPSDVTAVEVVSDAGSDDTYALGDTIRVRVTFAGKVNVDTAGGTPRLKIKMDPTWGEFWASYAGGSGSANLTFTHTVAKPNTSPRGIAVLANTLQANGGAIRLAATNANARLGHTGLGHDASHKVNWRLSPPVASTPPGAPTGVTVQGASNTGLSVSWTAPSDTGSVAIAGYELRWYAGASDPANASDWTETGDVGAGTSATIESLAADTAYRVQVRARGAGKGPWSASGAGRTQAAGDTTPPVPESATVNWREVTVTFDEDLVAVGAGAYLHFYFTVSGGGVQQHPVRATASGPTVTMQLGEGRPARAGRSYTIAYSGNGPLKDAAGNAVVQFGGLAAENLTQPRLSVADAKAHEGTDASMDFAVTLDAAMDEAVTVDYATADGSATAGEDYTAASGTLTFAAGERRKTVSVGVLDDAIDEGKETFRLRLSNAQGAVIEDGEAVGTITNSDPLQKMWLSRFGRTVADHVTGAVSDRLSAPLTGAQVTVAGQRVDLAAIEDEARLGETLTALARIMGAPSGPGQAANDPGSGPGQAHGWGPLGSGSGHAGSGSWPGTGLGASGSSTLDGTTTRDITGRELLLGSAFHLAREGDGGAPGLAAWGRVTVGGFDGEAPADEGSVRIDGSVTTGILGADAEWGRMLGGVAVSVSEGEGTFDQSGVDSGTIESTMTTVSPYARVNLSERVSVWALAGYGTGDMTIVQAANEATGQPERITRTDLSMRLAALGGRGALLTADESGGFDLALKADGFYVETTSEAISNEGDTTADASRVRLALEGSRAFQVGDGGVFTPGLELGLRHDGGDAETGTGVELGGRLTYTDPDTGLSVDASVRALVAHEDSDYREWGASGAVRLAPGERGRGLSFSLAPTYGAAGSGVDRLWSARDAQGLAPTGGDFEPESRLEGELGYGLALLGDRFTGTPNLGFGLSGAGARDYRIGWRLTSVVRGDPGFEVSLDATRREPANDNGAGAAEHGVMLRGAIRW